MSFEFDRGDGGTLLGGSGYVFDILNLLERDLNCTFSLSLSVDDKVGSGHSTEFRDPNCQSMIG